MFSKLIDKAFDFGGKNCNPRLYPVTKITPHHMAGCMSGLECARMHYNGDSVSANYYIGIDGSIVGGVGEEFRAWTSCNRDNDHRAITIECANSVIGGDWAISKATYDSLVRLCADICTRYNITPEYTGTPEGTITVHRMFTDTECPAQYIMGKIESKEFQYDILKEMGKSPDTPAELGECYVIKAGDTLTSIAKKFGTTVKFLKELNNIENADIIKTGEDIRTSLNYIVVSGDTLTDIARRYSTSVSRLVKVNDIEDPDHIEVGQKLIIK